ncbi:MAG TPA: hypothetical protein VLB76_24570 [Thermoanaerobaculia bacterium]|jgi:hypothetical protein|nr:hypothetical protein [Thermoanaerobaculia bacterium]
MIRPIPAVSILALLLLPLAAGAQAPAAPPATGAGASSPELRLEQRLLSLDLVAYKETRQREGLARQRVTDVLGRLDQALAADAVSLGTLEALQAELEIARGAAHAAEDKLNSQLERMGERLRRIALMTENGTAATRAADLLSGHWRVSIPSQNLSATFDLRLDGTLVTGVYQVNGSTAGSFRGNLAGNFLRMQRFDARGGFDSTWEGTVANGRITGIWTGNELVTGQPSRGQWTAVRESGQ